MILVRITRRAPPRRAGASGLAGAAAATLHARLTRFRGRRWPTRRRWTPRRARGSTAVSGPGDLFAGVDRAAFAAALGARLRRGGVPAGLTAIEAFTLALSVCSPTDRDRLYWLARLTLVRDHGQLRAFDAVFRAIFDEADLIARPFPGGRPRTSRRPRLSSCPCRPRIRGTRTRAPGSHGPPSRPWWVRRTTGRAGHDPRAAAEQPRGPGRHAVRAPRPRRAGPAGCLAGGGLSGCGRSAAPDDPSATRRAPASTPGPPSPQRAARIGNRSSWSASVASIVPGVCSSSATSVSRCRRTPPPTSTSCGPPSTPPMPRSSPSPRPSRGSRPCSRTARRRWRWSWPAWWWTTAFSGTRIATNLRALLASRHGHDTRGAIVVIAVDGWHADPPEALAAVMARLRRRAHRAAWRTRWPVRPASSPGWVPWRPPSRTSTTCCPPPPCATSSTPSSTSVACLASLTLVSRRTRWAAGHRVGCAVAGRWGTAPTWCRCMR